MSDIFREVDEEVRSDQFSKLWKRFAPVVYLTAGLIVVGTAGYRGYEYWQTKQSQAAGTEFLEAVKLSDAGNYAEAQAAFVSMEGAIGGYPMMAKMRVGTELALEGKSDEAIKLLRPSRQTALHQPSTRAWQTSAQLICCWTAVTLQL
ncbi:tetratricopeptide repeat protein [Pseudovibrio denitrificans]|uniref:tetratricopeptide repeat protein n=1 Tax=Pseudovibrio denitrificans TaxID=258256 RepID=UPI0006D27C19|nr:tetratricopeptide repeat protein [Pseudovibrio denitrificans]